MQGHCNFFAQGALEASQHEIDIKNIIGHYDLLLVWRSFKDRMGELNHGAKTKFKLVDVLTKHASHSKIPTSECPSADIVAINAMQVVQKMSKQASVKTFKGLADSFVRT